MDVHLKKEKGRVRRQTNRKAQQENHCRGGHADV